MANNNFVVVSKEFKTRIERLFVKYQVAVRLAWAFVFTIMVAIASLIPIYLMDIFVTYLASKNPSFVPVLAVIGVRYIFVVSLLVNLALFHYLNQHIIDFADYYKCAFNGIAFITGYVYFAGYYKDVLNMNLDFFDVFFKNQGIWGVPLTVLLFRWLIDINKLKQDYIKMATSYYTKE